MSSRLVRVPQVEVFEYPPAASVGTNPNREEDGTQEAEPTAEEIFQQGYQQGESAALEKAERGLDEVRDRFARSIRELATVRESVFREVERDLVRLALDIARKLVHREVQIDEKIILTLVRVALERMGEQEKLAVFVCPADYQVLRDHLRDPSRQGKDVAWVLKTDSSLQRGDCRVESGSGSVDGRISEQFREIEDGLLEQL